MKLSTRKEVYEAINGERDYQDSHRVRDTEQEFTSAEYITMMAHYFNELPAKWSLEPGVAPVGVLNNMRKIAAIAVQCMEVHGAVSREKEGRGAWGRRSDLEK